MTVYGVKPRLRNKHTMLNKSLDEVVKSDIKLLEVDDFDTLIWETAQKAVLLYKAQGWPLRHNFIKNFQDIEDLLRSHVEYALTQLQKGRTTAQIESGMIMLQMCIPKNDYLQVNFFFSI